MFSLNEPSALLSNARSTIATLIQRPATITTSNAFDEFSVLDQLIDVSNDVDRFEGGESRKFLNIAQLITASTCIYSRRVDALYKLINSFHSTDPKSDEDNESIPILDQEEEEKTSVKTIVQEKKKKIKESNRSFICQDLTKINLNSSKNFFLDRTSLFDLKLFQNYISIENKPFWCDDHRPMIFDLLFNQQILEQNEQEPERFIDILNQPESPPKQQPIFNENDIPLPLPLFAEEETTTGWNNNNHNEKVFEKKKIVRNRTKKLKNDLDLNIFRQGLTDDQQALFRFQKIKPISTKIKVEQKQFFLKSFHRKHFDALIKDSPPTILSIFIYPMITIHYLPIRERYSMTINRPESIRSPPIPITDVFNENISTPYSPTFIDDIQEDMDTRLQTDMEQMLDAAILNSHEEQEHNKIFLELRSSILTYMNKNESIIQTNLDDLVEILDENYSLPLIFSQLLHLCASTQRYYLHSTTNDNLFLEKIIK